MDSNSRYPKKPYKGPIKEPVVEQAFIRRPPPSGGSGGSLGPPRPRPQAPPPKPLGLTPEQKAEELAKSAGIPIANARDVIAGKMDLNEVIKKLAFQDEVAGMMKRHGFNRALATQILLGQVTLEAMLAKRRMVKHLGTARHRSVLEEAAEAGTEMQLCLHGRRFVHAKITAMEKYEFTMMDLETNEESKLHKLQVKCVWKSEDNKKARKDMTWDKERKEREINPITRPQQRYTCSDRRLGLLWDAKKKVVATTLEGESFAGQISWISRYEFGIQTRHGVEVVFLRHALDHLQELED